MSGTSLGTAVLELRTDDGAFESGLQRAKQSSEGFVKSVSQGMASAGESMVSTGKKMSLGLTAPIIGAATAIVTTGMSFEAEMSKIVGLVGIASDQVDDWGRDILTLAPQLGKAPQELAEALFFVTSAGFRGAEALDVLEIAGKASAAGLGQTATVADAITSAINAYGIENLSAASAADIMTAAVREGKLEASELAPVLGRILPTASAMGVSFEDVAGTLAVFSRTGVGAAQGATSLNAVLSAMLKPSKQANDTLADFGLTAGDLRDMMAEPGGVINVMRLLDETFGDNDEALAQVIPNVQAFRGVMNVLAQDADVVDDIMSGVANSTGALDAAFEAAQQTMRFKFNQAMAQVKSALIELSVIVMPFVSAGLGLLASGLERGMAAFRRLSPSVQRFGVIIAGVAAAIGPLLIVGGKLLILFASLLSPIGLVVLGLTALGVAIATNLGGIRDIATPVIDALANGFNRLRDAFTEGGLMGVLRELPSVLGDIAGAGKEVATNLIAALADVDWGGIATTILDGILSGLRTARGFVADVASWFWDVFTGINWGNVASTIADGIMTALVAVGGVAGRVLTWIYDGVTGIDWKDVATSIGTGIWDGINSAVDAGKRLGSWIGDKAGSVDWSGTATSIGDGIWGVLTSAYDGATRLYNWINDGVSGIDWAGTAGSIADGIGSALGTVQGWGETFGTWLQGQIDGHDFGTIATSLTDGLGDGLETVSGWGTRFTDWFSEALDEGGWTAVGTKIGEKLEEGAEAAGLGDHLSTLINDVRQTIEDLGVTVSTSLTPMMEEHGDTIDNKVLPAWANIKSDFGEAAGIISSSVKPAFDDLKQALGDAGFAGEQILEVFRHFQPAFSTIASAVGTFIAGSLLVLAQTLSATLPGAAKIFTGAIEAITGVFSVVAAGIGIQVGVIVKLLQGDLGGAFEVAREGAGRMWEGIKTAFSGGASVVEGIWSIFWETTVGIIDRAVQLITGKSMVELVNGMASRIIEIHANFVNGVTRMASDVLTQFTTMVSNVISKVAELPGELARIAREAIDGLVGALSDGASRAAGAMESIKSAIVGAFSDPYGLLNGIGSTIVSGLIDGLTSRIGDVASAASNLGSAIRNNKGPIEKDRVMLYPAGRAIVQGLIHGLQSGQPEVEQVSQDIGQSVLAGMPSGESFHHYGDRHAKAYAAGLTSGTGDVTAAAAGLTNDANEAVINQLGGGRHFQAETFLAELTQFNEFLVAQVVESATRFEGELLDAAKGYMDAAQSGVSLMSNALDLMATLGASNASLGRAMQAVTELKELTEHIVLSIGDSAGWVNASRPEGFLAVSEEYMQSAQAGVTLMQQGAELMAALMDVTGDLDRAKDAASDIKFLTEHIVLSLGDSAEYLLASRSDGFVGLAAEYADLAGKGVELMSKGADLLAKLSEATGNLDSAKASATDIKFLTEHIVLSIGDSADYIAAVRGPGFIAHAASYAESAATGIDLMLKAAELVRGLEDVTFDLEIAKTAATDMKFLTEHIVTSLGDSAQLFTESGLAHIHVYADAAQAGFDVMQGVAPVLDAMLAFGEADTSGIDLRTRAADMAELTRLVVAEMQSAAGHFETEGLAATTQFSSAADSALDTIGKAGDALEAILTFATVQTGDRDLTRLAASMVDLIEIVVRQIELVAVHFETKGLESVERFSQSASKALDVMGSAGDALSAVLMYGALSPGERDQLKHLAWEMTGVMDYLVDMIRQMSTQYSTDAIEHLSKFAAAVKQSLDIISGAAKAFEAMVDHSRVTSQHADSFVASWEVMAWALQEIARIISTQGVQDAIRILNANQEIFTYMQQAFDLWQQSQQLAGQMGGTAPSTGASGVKPQDIKPVTSPTTGGASTTPFVGQKPVGGENVRIVDHPEGYYRIYEDGNGRMLRWEYVPKMALGGVSTDERDVRVHPNEAIIPLDNGGASIIASELVKRMQASPEWSRMTGGMQLPLGTFAMSRNQQKSAGDVDVNFYGNVTILARDQEDARRSAGDLGWHLRQKLRAGGQA